MDRRGIGVFDSGLGGLTAASVLERILPHEDIIYFGDSGRMPYGGRSKAELCTMSMQNAAFLESFDVKAVLVACGTVSSNAMEELRAAFEMPFFGVIDAACAAAVKATKVKRVGVIATQACIRSGVYEQGIKALDESVQILAHACPPFVAMVENGHFRPGDHIAEETVARELAVFRNSGIDTLLLGCTHYPLLSDIIGEYLGRDIIQISSGAEAAIQFADYLRTNGLLTDGKGQGRRRWYTSGDIEAFTNGAEVLLGHHIQAGQHIIG